MPDQPPGGAQFRWSHELPPTPVEGDGTPFFDGPCFFYCQGITRRVFWAGSIQVPGVTVSAQLCETCARILQRVVVATKLRSDIARVRQPPSAP